MRDDESAIERDFCTRQCKITWNKNMVHDSVREKKKYGITSTLLAKLKK